MIAIARATPLHRCLDCLALIASGTRCSAHERVREQRRGYSTRRGLGSMWQRAARAAVEAHVQRYGWWCPGYKREAHVSHDLTADHRVARARGGGPDIGAVMCRSCNSAKGAR